MSPTLTAPPVSMPPASRWPPSNRWAGPGADQPPLPWTSDGQAETPVAQTIGMQHLSTPAGGVRLIVTGAAWSPEPVAGLVDPAPACLRMVTAILEVRQGARPVEQLRRRFTRRALAAIGSGAPGRTRQRVPMSLLSVHLQLPAATSVEAVAVYRIGGREEAMAIRLEARDRQWMCTAYETQPGRSPVPSTGSGLSGI